MAMELLWIKFLAVAITVFDFVLLIDGVKRYNLALMETSVGKPSSDDCTSRENRRKWWRNFGVRFWFAGGVATF